MSLYPPSLCGPHRRAQPGRCVGMQETSIIGIIATNRLKSKRIIGCWCLQSPLERQGGNCAGNVPLSLPSVRSRMPMDDGCRVPAFILGIAAAGGGTQLRMLLTGADGMGKVFGSLSLSLNTMRTFTDLRVGNYEACPSVKGHFRHFQTNLEVLELLFPLRNPVQSLLEAAGTWLSCVSAPSTFGSHSAPFCACVSIVTGGIWGVRWGFEAESCRWSRVVALGGDMGGVLWGSFASPCVFCPTDVVGGLCTHPAVGLCCIPLLVHRMRLPLSLAVGLGRSLGPHPARCRGVMLDARWAPLTRASWTGAFPEPEVGAGTRIPSLMPVVPWMLLLPGTPMGAELLSLPLQAHCMHP